MGFVVVNAPKNTSHPTLDHIPGPGAEACHCIWFGGAHCTFICANFYGVLYRHLLWKPRDTCGECSQSRAKKKNWIQIIKRGCWMTFVVLSGRIYQPAYFAVLRIKTNKFYYICMFGIASVICTGRNAGALIALRFQYFLNENAFGFSMAMRWGSGVAVYEGSSDTI